MRVLLFALASLCLAGSALAQSNVGGPPPRQPPPSSRNHEVAPGPNQNMLDHMNEAVNGQSAVRSTTCRIGNVGVFGNRVHVRCAAIESPIQAPRPPLGNLGQSAVPMEAWLPTYFAVSLQSDAALANMTVSLATAAAAQNKQVQILFTAGAGANPTGCAPNDCRRLIGMLMLVRD